MTFDEIIGQDPEPDFSMLAKEAFQKLNAPPPPPIPSSLPSPPADTSLATGRFFPAIGHAIRSFAPQGDFGDMNQKVDLSKVPFPTSISPSQEMMGLTGSRPMPMEGEPMNMPGIAEIRQAPPGSQERADRIAAMGIDLLGASRGFWRGGTGIPKTVMKEIWREPAREIAGAGTAMKNSPSGSGKPYVSQLPPRRGTDYQKSIFNSIEQKDFWGVKNALENANRDDLTIRIPPEHLGKMSPEMVGEYMKHTLDRVGADIRKLMGAGDDFDAKPPPYEWEQP